jgi:hypothetical protein
VAVPESSNTWLAMLSLDERVWLVRRPFKKGLKPGDTVYLRESGAEGEIVALKSPERERRNLNGSGSRSHRD